MTNAFLIFFVNGRFGTCIIFLYFIFYLYMARHKMLNLINLEEICVSPGIIYYQIFDGTQIENTGQITRPLHKPYP